MLVSELRKKVVDAGGIFQGAHINIRITDDDLDVHTTKENELVAWFPKGHEEEEVAKAIAMANGTLAQIDCFNELASIVGIPVGTVHPQKVEVPVKDERETNTLKDALEREKKLHEQTRNVASGARSAFESVVHILAQEFKG